MKTVKIADFDGGFADDYTDGQRGECSMCKHFDVLSYPKRLQPLRGMTTESTTNSSIQNIITAADGIMYGIGTEAANPTFARLWYRQGYGASDVWTQVSSQAASTALRVSGANDDAAFLVDYPEAGNVRSMFWAATNLLFAGNPAGGSSPDSQALTFTTISQGFVHPKDKMLYFGYQTATQTFIGRIGPNATSFGSVALTALELPKRYRVYSLTNYGDFLAIGVTASEGGSSTVSSVILWDRDTSLATVSDIIPWGAGQLKVLNNLNGALVGVSRMSSNSTGSVQDHDSIFIKMWAGGAEPTLIKEISATRLTATAPSCSINPHVNFVYNGRLFFSIDVVNGGAAPDYYGLWSVGRTKSGRWAVQIERMATSNGSHTSVLAASIAGDFVSMCHTAAGTLTYTTNGNNLAVIYGATSVYESLINPNIDPIDAEKKKQIKTAFISTLPLPDDATVTLKYRVDSSLSGSWTTLITETTNGTTVSEINVNGLIGRKFEFRLESTGGAIITSFGFKYETLESLI
ncbi:hypothetical protein [Bradyrhizobium sp. AUGA SZCCT0431]|uniref:hypothetical protein n=1 Tax=Bradyrhizobium sp. AUGA SZCCT0431 TaxID=2807674 RepID=UPI001BAA0620|nr:hypothetical protein [Bradyrhizobium sp. AUGA SZCCT0431]MBR1146676.1 hypothetical protein [Bradyrhizobium sp. AUGA SZCCT0431]